MIIKQASIWYCILSKLPMRFVGIERVRIGADCATFVRVFLR